MPATVIDIACRPAIQGPFDRTIARRLSGATWINRHAGWNNAQWVGMQRAQRPEFNR